MPAEAKIEESGALTPEEEKYFEQRGEVDPPGVPEEASAAEPPEDGLDDRARAAPAPTEEPAADAVKSVAEVKPEPEAKSVPLASLLEERRAAREREQRMEERFQLLVQSLAPKAEPPKVPTIEEDPVGALKQINEWKQTQERQSVEQQQEANLIGWYRANASQYAEKQGDFHEAYTFWQQSIAGELADAMGYVDPLAIERQVQQFEKNIALQAAQQGANPAERIYKAAQRRGYKLEAPAAVAKPEGGNGAATDKQIATIGKGAAAGKTLATTGGTGGESEISLRALAEMPMEEFLEISEKAFRRANGV